MINSTASASWTALAPCAGVDGYVADDALAREPRRLLDACGPLMEDCAALCPFVQRCYERVRPSANRFDGVCAARVWINGKPIAKAANAPELAKLPTQAGTCGTSSGVAGHRRLGEPLCADCRVTALRAGARRAGAATIRKRAARASRPIGVAP